MVDAEPNTTESVLAIIKAFKGCDCYGSVSISSIAIETACSIVRARAVPPDAFLRCDGGVQLEWHVNGVDLEILIHHDGVISYLLEQERAHLTTVRMLLEQF